MSLPLKRYLFLSIKYGFCRQTPIFMNHFLRQSRGTIKGNQGDGSGDHALDINVCEIPNILDICLCDNPSISFIFLNISSL